MDILKLKLSFINTNVQASKVVNVFEIMISDKPQTTDIWSHEWYKNET